MTSPFLGSPVMTSQEWIILSHHFFKHYASLVRGNAGDRSEWQVGLPSEWEGSSEKNNHNHIFQDTFYSAKLPQQRREQGTWVGKGSLCNFSQSLGKCTPWVIIISYSIREPKEIKSGTLGKHLCNQSIKDSGYADHSFIQLMCFWILR